MGRGNGSDFRQFWVSYLEQPRDIDTETLEIFDVVLKSREKERLEN